MTEGVDFHAIYEERILPRQQRAERLRKRMLLNYGIVTTAFFTAFLFEAVTLMLIAITALIVFVLIYIHRYWIDRESFEERYRQEMFATGLASFGDFAVEQGRYMPLAVFSNSRLFRGLPTDWDGDFLAQGNYCGARVRLSEIRALERGLDRLGQSGNRFAFSGLLLTAKSSTALHAQAGLVMGQDDAMPEAPVEDWKADGWTEKNGPVWADPFAFFDRLFDGEVVDLARGHYRRHGSPVRMAFHGSTLYIAVQRGRSRFPIRLFRSLIDPEEAQGWHEELQTALGLVRAVYARVEDYSKV